MKKSFLTGLVLLFPFVITFLLALWLLYFLSIPFYSLYHSYFSSPLLSRFLSLISVVATVIVFGFFAQYYIIKTVVSALHRFLAKVPLVRSIYHASYEVVTVLVREESRGFSEAVLVSYPSPTSKIIGFVPRRDFQISSHMNQNLIPVFIPGTVNPLMGYLIFTTEEYIKPLKITSKEAFIWTISLAGNNPF